MGLGGYIFDIVTIRSPQSPILILKAPTLSKKGGSSSQTLNSGLQTLVLGYLNPIGKPFTVAKCRTETIEGSFG